MTEQNDTFSVHVYHQGTDEHNDPSSYILTNGDSASGVHTTDKDFADWAARALNDLAEERDSHREHLAHIAEELGEGDDIGAAWEAVHALKANHDRMLSVLEKIVACQSDTYGNATHLHLAMIGLAASARAAVAYAKPSPADNAA